MRRGLRWRLLLLFLVLLSERASAHDALIVWNVGQGLWTTIRRESSCLHFDMGGERLPQAALLRELCELKMNSVYFSHWDWDHVRFAALAARTLPGLCVAAQPGGPHPRRRSPVDEVPPCKRKSSSLTSVDELTRGTRVQGHDSNSESRVFVYDRRIILPGDSPSREEKIWDRREQLNGETLLVLGHHGSRTATSEDLLRHAPHLRQAVASARFAKYGHPHAEVIARLKRFGIALVRTEDWGTLIFEL